MNHSSSSQERKAFNLILFAEFWEMFSFFGIVSIIVLYTSKSLALNDQQSYLIYSVFLTLFCGLPILGGYIADNFLSLYSCLMIGSLMMAMGNLFIGLGGEQFLYLGLTAVICGAAIFKPSCTNLIGHLAPKVHYKNPEKAYSTFYVVLNLGALFSPLIFGLVLLLSFSFSYCFYLSSLGLFVVSRTIGFHRKLIMSLTQEESGNTNYMCYLIILSTFLLILFVIEKYNAFHNVILILMITFFYMFYNIYKKQSESGRRSLFALSGLLVFCMIFFAASLQVGSTLTLYLDRYVDKSINGMNIPTSVFVK